MKKICFLFLIILFSCETERQQQASFIVKTIGYNYATYYVLGGIVRLGDGCIKFTDIYNDERIVCGGYTIEKHK